MRYKIKALMDDEPGPGEEDFALVASLPDVFDKGGKNAGTLDNIGADRWAKFLAAQARSMASTAEDEPYAFAGAQDHFVPGDIDEQASGSKLTKSGEFCGNQASAARTWGNIEKVLYEVSEELVVV